jgi:tetratricopeptide (TPR) repeat protein
MNEKRNKILSFPSPVPSKADYQRVKSAYTVREIKQLFGLSERTIRRWTEQGIVQASSSATSNECTYGFHALTQFRRVRDLRAQGQTMRQVEAELQGQLSLFRAEEAQITRLLTPFEEALVLHEQGDAKAAEYYLEAINEGDNIAEAYCNLALINLERGDAAKALDQLTHSLKHNPRHVEAHYNLANLYYDHGDFPLARLHYEAAVQIEPAFSLVYFNLALVYHRLNNVTGAAAALARYRELAPDDKDIEALDELLRVRAEMTARPPAQ